MLNKLCVFTFLSALSLSSFIGAIEYEIHDIGTLQTPYSQATAINNKGQILGWYYLKTPSERHFFVRDPKGSFHEIPGAKDGLPIEWKYLTDDGIAYGIFAKNGDSECPILFKWDQQNGIVNLGELPGGISAINNSGQILIRCIKENLNGKTNYYTAIWKDGNLTKLKRLEGDLGIEADSSVGVDMNNSGDVVGYSQVYLSYKNELYKQTHATKWINGQAIDLHNEVPKSAHSSAIAINDLGEIFLSQRRLIRDDGTVIIHPIGSSNAKMTNTRFLI